MFVFCMNFIFLTLFDLLSFRTCSCLMPGEFCVMFSFFYLCYCLFALLQMEQ